MTDLKAVAVFGGTFDPIHNGHVQSALELKQRLLLDELWLLPCHLPPHRQLPGCSSEQRLAMVHLAVEGTCLKVDDREMHRDSISYSVETLEQLRKEHGDEVSLSWVMGSDAFAGLNSWHRWQDILSLSHIIVMARPGEPLPDWGPVAKLLGEHQGESASALKRLSRGVIWLERLSPYPISATQIRAAIASHSPVQGYLPEAVLNYIEDHQLYQA